MEFKIVTKIDWLRVTEVARTILFQAQRHCSEYETTMEWFFLAVERVNYLELNIDAACLTKHFFGVERLLGAYACDKFSWPILSIRHQTKEFVLQFAGLQCGAPSQKSQFI